MGLSTSVLTAIHGGARSLPALAALLGREKRAIAKAVQVLKRRGLVSTHEENGGFAGGPPRGTYALTEAGAQAVAAGEAVSPGQGERPRVRTIGLRERAWWEFRAHKLASLKQITGTHAEGAENCTGSDCLDTVLQLRRPFAWHKPDGLRGVA